MIRLRCFYFLFFSLYDVTSVFFCILHIFKNQGVHYFSSLNQTRLHLAQNPCLTQAWGGIWQALHREHGWRAVLTDSACRNITSASLVESQPVACLFLSDRRVRPAAAAAAAAQNYIQRWLQENGAVEHGDVEDRQACTLTEGVHKFSSWRALQYYIHRY